MSQISYAIDTDGLTYGLYNGFFSYYSLNYEEMSPENNYETSYDLKLCKGYPNGHLFMTKKIPLSAKNIHRQAHGIKPLKEESVQPRWFLDWGITLRPNDTDYTAPDKVKELLLEYGEMIYHFNPKSIKRVNAYNNPEIGKVWVFDCPSKDIELIVNAIAECYETNHLSLRLCCWRT